MQRTPEIFLTLLFFTFLLLLILIFVIVFFRFLRKREKKISYGEMDALTDAFKTLGSEINTLREELILKDQFAAMGEVSAGIAHQLRNPLAVIAGYSKLLLKSLEENDKRVDMINAILKEVDEMNRVIEELFKLSRHKQIEKKELDINNLIKKIINNLSEGDKKLYFEESGPIIIKADEVLLSQAIKNIIHNAIDVSDDVRIELVKSTVGGEGVVINIIDKGKGIPKEHINKLFKPFYTTKDDGIGLGLTIAHKIIFAHGGKITVDSIQGGGSTFRIFLPKN